MSESLTSALREQWRGAFLLPQVPDAVTTGAKLQLNDVVSHWFPICLGSMIWSPDGKWSFYRRYNTLSLIVFQSNCELMAVQNSHKRPKPVGSEIRCPLVS